MNSRQKWHLNVTNLPGSTTQMMLEGPPVCLLRVSMVQANYLVDNSKYIFYLISTEDMFLFTCGSEQPKKRAVINNGILKGPYLNLVSRALQSQNCNTSFFQKDHSQKISLKEAANSRVSKNQILTDRDTIYHRQNVISPFMKLYPTKYDDVKNSDTTKETEASFVSTAKNSQERSKVNLKKFYAKNKTINYQMSRGLATTKYHNHSIKESKATIIAKLGG